MATSYKIQTLNFEVNIFELYEPYGNIFACQAAVNLFSAS